MRHLTTQKRPSWKILSDILGEMAREALRGEERGLSYLTPEKGEVSPNDMAVANWILARYFAMPESERDRFMREGKEETDRHLSADRMVPFSGKWSFAEANSAPVPAVAQGHRVEDEPVKGKRQRSG